MNLFFGALMILLGLGLILGAAAFFTALESAALICNRQSLRDMDPSGDPAVRLALRRLAETPKLLAASLMAQLSALILAGGLLKAAFHFYLPLIPFIRTPPAELWWAASSSFWTLLILPPVFLLCVRIIPRQWAHSHSGAFLRLCSPAASWAIESWIAASWAVSRSVSWACRKIGLPGWLEPAGFTREDLEDLVSDSNLPAASTPGAQRRMIRSILSLGETLVREVMRPIGEVVTLRIGDITPAKILDLARRHKYTRYPVYRERMIDLIGYVNIYDILEDPNPAKPVEEYLLEALYVPETARVANVLHEFLRHKTQCAIVFDEHGSCSGWVTREDILEQIVGNLDQENEQGEQSVVREDEGVYRVDPRLDLDDLNRILGGGRPELEKIHCETAGGFVYSYLGRVPLPGERIYLRRWILEVVTMDRHNIKTLRLIRRPSQLQESQSSPPSDSDDKS